MSDHRKHLRVESRLRCWCEGENVTFYARVGNLSEGGLFLRTSTPLPAGCRTQLRLRNGDASEVVAEATVVWSREDGRESPAGMGLRFETLDEKAREKLRQLIAHQFPLQDGSK